jgi:2-dehydro-3-deoxyglucarate aldolase/4-hydroxy-2-oxoheptanedioate aldolase
MPHLFKLKQKLKEGKPLTGMIQTLDSPEIAEILSTAGFDWIFVDLEHSTLNAQAAQRILQAAAGNCPCILRAPCHDEAWIKKLLDIGSAGILFPRVNSAEEAGRIVKYCKYPPVGSRSVGLARAHGYGLTFQEYVDSANDDIAIVIQIEDIKAVNNIDEIVKVPGIDALFIGPYDLSGSMGKPGEVRDPEVMEKIETVRLKGLEAGLAMGIFTVNPEDVKDFIEKGYTLIAVDIDTSLLAKTVKKTLQAIHG